MADSWAMALIRELFKGPQVTLDVEYKDQPLQGQPEPPVSRRCKLLAIVADNTVIKDARHRLTRTARIVIPTSNARRLSLSDVVTLPDGYRMSVDRIEILNPSGQDLYYEASLRG